MMVQPLDTIVMKQTTNAATNRASTTQTDATQAGGTITGTRTTRGFAVVVAASVAVVAAAMAPVVAAAVGVAVVAVAGAVAAARRDAGRATGPPDETRTETSETTPVAAD